MTMTWAGRWCLLRGGGTYTLVFSDFRGPPDAAEIAATAAEQRRQGRRPGPPRTCYWAKCEPICKRCGKNIWTHLDGKGPHE